MHHIKQSSRVMMVLVPRGWGEIKTGSERAQGCKYISEFEQVLFEIWTNTLLCIVMMVLVKCGGRLKLAVEKLKGAYLEAEG